MARHLRALALMLWGVSGSNVIQVDMFRVRAKTRATQHPMENINAASLAGVLKLVHTDFITEHEIYPYERPARKGDIDVIWKATYQVKNPNKLVAYPKNDRTYATKVDFGPYMNFESGQCKDAHSQELVAKYGDFVGVQDPNDRRFPFDDPYFWFSLSGFCPNQTFAEKYTAGAPNPMCMNYSNASGLVVAPVQGGHCQGIPTGKPGCTYSFSEETTVWIDQLAGITDEDCGGRKCLDWDDFRKHCGNNTYKQKFDPATNEVVPTDYCVEYDINPQCASDCDSEECQGVPKDSVELGLPFWRGRCNAKANHKRAEKLAGLFGFEGATTAHKLVSAEVRNSAQTCLQPDTHFCIPNDGEGGMFCTRLWDGVCQPCYIPGTKTDMPHDQHFCPYDILSHPDYKGKHGNPDCESKSAKKLCCLYTGTCSVGQVADPLTVPLTEDGFQLMGSAQNSTAMALWLARVIQGKGMVPSDARALEAFAYDQWSPVPATGRSLKKVEAEMKKQGLYAVPSKSDGVPAVTTAPVGVSVTTAAPSSPPQSGSSGLPWWVFLIIGLFVLLCLACLGGVAAYTTSGSEKYDDMEVKGKKDKIKAKKRERQPLHQTPQAPAYATPLVQSESVQAFQTTPGAFQLASGQQLMQPLPVQGVQGVPHMVSPSGQPIYTVAQALPTYTVASSPVPATYTPLPSVR